MAKQGFTLKSIPNLVDKDDSWALCVGSGISYPVFPMWDKLAEKIVKKFVPAADDLALEELKKKMSSEVLLQSATEMVSDKKVDFSKELANVLYEDFFQGLAEEEVNLIKKCLSCDPGVLDLDWGRYKNLVMSKTKGQLTAMDLAKSILKLQKKGHGPSSILSFNAEMLLGSLMNTLARLEGEKKKFFDYIIEPTSSHFRDRIPYFFCHGVMPIPGTKHMAFNKFNACDRLVFLENEYLQLANSSYSWQASAFLNTLSSHTVFFVGLSFVDPNIRRWLAWIQEEKLKAIHKKSGSVHNSTSHYWIEKKPDSVVKMRMMESSVSHLGIRIIWIDDWHNAGFALEKAIVV